MKFTKIDIDSCYAYLIVTEKNNGILIDPKLDYGNYYLNILEQNKVKLKLIIDTHTHADHLSAGIYLKEATGASYGMYEKSKSIGVDRKFKDLEEFYVDELHFKIIYTPGHTDNSMSVICEDKLFTGDFLFLDGSGRDDLPTGNSKEHFESLKKLENLEDYLVICPAHNYAEHELSSLYQVKKENEILKCKTLEGFIEITKPEGKAPEWMQDVIKLNTGGNADLKSVDITSSGSVCQKGKGKSGSLDNVGYIDKDELKETMKMKLKTVILDVREEKEFKELKPIEGSIFISIKELPNRLDEIEKYKGQTFITVCKTGVRALKAAKIIKGANIGTAFVLKGGIEEFRKNEK